MRCHKGTPFDHVSLMISTNQKPGLLALSQWEAMVLQQFMSTINTQANQAVSRRGHSIRITIPKASSSEICENYRVGALSWNLQGGDTELESMGRGHSIGITIPKEAPSQICENHGAGALSWNPQDRGTQFGMRCHKGPPMIMFH